MTSKINKPSINEPSAHDTAANTVIIEDTLTDTAQRLLLQYYLSQLSSSEQRKLQQMDDLNVMAVVDGRGLACPMPLLKTKIALKSLPTGSSVYVLATDPNSQTDLAAFSTHAQLDMRLNTVNQSIAPDSLEKLDTIFHLIITKTHGN